MTRKRYGRYFYKWIGAMPMRGPLKKWLTLCAVLLCIGSSDFARADDAMALEIATLATDQPYSARQVARGEAGPWHEDASRKLHFRGGTQWVHWLRIRASLPPTDDGRWVLWFDRAPLTDLTLMLPDSGGEYVSQSRQFFRADADAPWLASGFHFDLPPQPAGPIELLVQVRSDAYASMRPFLMPLAEYRAMDRRNAIALTALYASLSMLALTGLAMFLALRDRLHGAFVGFSTSSLLLLLALNGHLYTLPVLDALGYWREMGILALANLTAGFTMMLVRGFANLGREAPRCDLMLLWAARLLLLLAAACLLNLRPLVALFQAGSLALWGMAGFVAVSTSLIALRKGRQLARPMLFIWAMMFGASAARGLVSFGWVPQNTLTVYGFQLALAFGAFLLSLAMADQVMEFRKQRDRARLAMEQADASLQVEQVRRRLVETLRSGLRAAPSGDLEWIALRRLLDAVQHLVPQRRSAIAVFGYHGIDQLITEPTEAKDHFAHMVAARGGTMKGICRTSNAVQVRLEDGPDEPDGEPGGALYAIVPLPLPRPAWGVLLIERAGWEAFDSAELRIASEFAAMALQAADEAAASQELRDKADRDPLTGALNRRAIETHLAREMEIALARRAALAVLFVEVDQFAQINDRFGPATADDCLRAVAEVVHRALGAEDAFGRYSGEQYLLVLPGRSAEQARSFAERVRKAASDVRIASNTGPCQFTVSVGGTVRAPAEQTLGTVVERADKALHAAKRAGRNQVQMIAVFASPSTGSGAPQLF